MLCAKAEQSMLASSELEFPRETLKSFHFITHVVNCELRGRSEVGEDLKSTFLKYNLQEKLPY